jgi:hypothetical protein
MLEGIQPFVIPADQRALWSLFQIWNVDLHHVFLADTIETTDTLFQ